MKINLPTACVYINPESVWTVLNGGGNTMAMAKVQPEQVLVAKQWGLDPAEMNRTHDLTHSLLAAWLGLPASPTLRGVADDQFFEYHQIEEAAVLAIQSLANICNVDLIEVAKRMEVK